jgi:hypothetical protein
MPARFAQSGTVFEIELAREQTELVERRLGPSSSVERRGFSDERAAIHAYFERIAELVETKWERRSPCEHVEESATSELLEGVTAGDPTAIAVYNDWLLDRGDPRGELASLRAAEPDPEVASEIELVEREHAIELFGLLAVLHPRYREQFELIWRNGWIDTVIARHKWFSDGGGMYGEDAREAVHHVLHAPMARFVRRLELDGSFAHACATFRGCRHTRRIRAIRLVEARSIDVIDAFPELEELETTAIATRGHPSVRTLTLRAGRGAIVNLTDDWPRLQRLAIILDGADLQAYRSMRSWFRACKLPALAELAISSERRLPAAVIDALVEGSIPDRLRLLELDVEPTERAMAKLERRGIVPRVTPR